MAFRAVDFNNDWIFGNGMSAYAIENNEIALNLKTRILSFLNDCFFDLEAGIDWFNLLDYGKQEEIENAIKATIIETPNVMAINNLEVVFTSNRKLLITYNIDTIYSSGYENTLTQDLKNG